ncbi:MAG: DUF3090 family protein [Nitriliruptorales bacterium]
MSVELPTPDHVTADFVGEPGDRSFFIQAIENAEVVNILVEKGQVAGLAELLTELLGRVGSVPPSVWDVETMRLREPVVARWRGGAIAVGIEPALGRFLIEVTEFVPPDEEREPDEARIWLSEEEAATLAAHAAWAVAQGRPTCRFCGLPLDEGEPHVCPRSNGDARHT